MARVNKAAASATEEGAALPARRLPVLRIFRISLGIVIVVGVAFLSGVGSGAFHPLGAVTVRSQLPPRGMNMAMSIYVTAGTFGLAAGPLIGVVAFGLFGLRGTAFLLVPGLLIAAYLVFAMRSAEYAVPRRSSRQNTVRQVLPLVPLAATVGVMASRS